MNYIKENLDYHEYLAGIKKGVISHFSREELYKAAYAAFMVTDFDFSWYIIGYFQKKYPQDIRIYDIVILILGDTGKYKDALKILKTLGLYNPIGYIGLGNILYYLGEYERAILILKKGLLIFPDNHIISYSIGNCYLSQGKYQQAFLFYIESLKNKKYLYSYCKILRIHRLRADSQNFQSIYKYIIFLLERDTCWDKDLIYGNIFFEKGEYKTALYHFQNYMFLRPKDTFTLNAIGNCYSLLGDNTQAILYFQKSLEINNYNIYSYNSLLKSYISLSDDTAITSLLIKISNFHSCNFTTYYLVAKYYFFSNDFQNAYYYYNKAHLIQPSHEMCLRYLKKTKKILGITN